MWQSAINDELTSINDNNTWTIIPQAPQGRQLIGCRWIFKKKFGADGAVTRYKARLVAKGYAQQQGIDYDETYAPVAKFTSIRTILSLGASLDLEIHQMDVKTAFLNGDLEEDIYMKIPEGVHTNFATTSCQPVCKLNRTLYGLKQSPRMWNKKIDEYLRSRGFLGLQSDHGVYIRRSDDSVSIIVLYVNDLLLLTNSSESMKKLKTELSNKFAMTDCGEIHQFLGLRILRDRQRKLITVDQHQLTHQILNRFQMTECKSVATPLDPSRHLIKRSAEGGENKNSDDDAADPTLFRQIIGSLMYLMIGSRPDIAAAISIISQFAADPSRYHYAAAKRVIRYLKGTINYQLHLGSTDESLKLIGYCDANWGNDISTRRSTTGYLFYLSGGVISWSSKRQPTVALSSTEAEYMAITHATKEAIWLRSLMNELGYDQSTPTLIFEDNQSCIALAKNPVHHARTKHIDIQHHFIREKVKSREIELEYISTNKMIADALTKSLPKPEFIRHIRLMKLENDNADRTDNDSNIIDVNQTDRTIRHSRSDQHGRI